MESVDASPGGNDLKISNSNPQLGFTHFTPLYTGIAPYRDVREDPPKAVEAGEEAVEGKENSLHSLIRTRNCRFEHLKYLTTVHNILNYISRLTYTILGMVFK